jgi:hypothetical protein
MGLYINFPIRLHGVVLTLLSTGATLLLPYICHLRIFQTLDFFFYLRRFFKNLPLIFQRTLLYCILFVGQYRIALSHLNTCILTTPKLYKHFTITHVFRSENSS